MGSRYILFIDESGKSTFSDPGNSFLLSGLIIDKDLHTALSHYMISLKEKSDIPADENIHAFDLFENEQRRTRDARNTVVTKRINYSEIDTFFERLTSLIDGASMHSLVFCADKQSYQEKISQTASLKSTTERAVTNYLKRKHLHEFLYEALARKMILEFGHFLEKQDAVGEIMAESRRNDDETVLSAFLSSTVETTFAENSRYVAWARSSKKRINSLTFQNKKGLSFGLEVADLFAWAHFNKKHGRSFPIASVAKAKRVDSRIKRADDAMGALYLKQPEDITPGRVISLAKDRVSEFTNALREFKA